MSYILQITDQFREMYDEIVALRFVIYSYEPEKPVQKFFWIRPSELSEKLGWITDHLKEVADKNDIDPDKLGLGLGNCVLTAQGRRYIPMIDFGPVDCEEEGVPEEINVALELLNVGHGVIVRSSKRQWGSAGFHFFGLDLWTKDQWQKFIDGGAWDKYGFSDGKFPRWAPDWPYFAAEVVGYEWGQLVVGQKYAAFLRLVPNYYREDVPEIVDLFSGDSLLNMPLETAPCMPAYRQAEQEWYEGARQERERARDDLSQDYNYPAHPEVINFCVPGCLMDGCSIRCPKVRSRLGLGPKDQTWF